MLDALASGDLGLWFVNGGRDTLASYGVRSVDALPAEHLRWFAALPASFDDGRRFRLPYEFLRVHSPSAEVRGHGPGQETLQTGKRDVTIANVEPIGHYALRPSFSDGHDSGIYSWEYLHDLGIRQHELWQRYVERLAAAGASREQSG